MVPAEGYVVARTENTLSHNFNEIAISLLARMLPYGYWIKFVKCNGIKIHDTEFQRNLIGFIVKPSFKPLYNT